MRILVLLALSVWLSTGVCAARVAPADARSAWAVVNDLRTAQFNVVDDRGQSMDCLQIQPDGRGGFLGVYHANRGDDTFELLLATSADLRSWHRVTSLGLRRSMGVLHPLAGGGFLLADERSRADRDSVGRTLVTSQIEIRYFPGLEALLTGRSAASYLAPRTLSASNEGTPSFTSVRWGGDLARSRIVLGLHYLGRGDVDRNATGVLTAGRRWVATPATALNRRFTAAGASGNLGGRDEFRWRGRELQIFEAQIRRGDWSAWRLWLLDGGSPVRLAPITPHGSRSFGNPHATLLSLPSGRDVLAISAFVFSEGSGVGEAGQMVKIVPVP